MLFWCLQEHVFSSGGNGIGGLFIFFEVNFEFDEHSVAGVLYLGGFGGRPGGGRGGDWDALLKWQREKNAYK